MGLFDKLKQTATNAISDVIKESESFTQIPSSSNSFQQPLQQSATPPPFDNDSNGIYSDKLNKLIDMALADGQLTEKEKQILFKNAQREGIDLDEFEMVLEAKLYERSYQTQQYSQVSQQGQVSQVAPKSSKYGDVRKCPACGAILQSFQSRCVECGHEIIGSQANASIQKLFEMINDIELTRKSGTNLLFDALLGGNPVDQRKMECIKNFPIPTTREDILEFLCFALPLAKKQKTSLFRSNYDENLEKHNAFVPTWKAKCEQIIMKARFLMKDDKATLEEIENYAKELKLI